MEGLDLDGLILERMASEDEELLEFQDFLESEKSCYELSALTDTGLPISSPDSCSLTPSSSEVEKIEIEDRGFLEEYDSDAPELKHYLKQTNPLQKIPHKRKSERTLEKNENLILKKFRREEQDKGAHKTAKVENSEESCQGQRKVKWSPFKSGELHKLYDSSLAQTEPPSLKVTCDKGFTFSPFENVFICQKKNHFQITLVLNVPQSESFIKLKDVYQNVTSYKIHLYAVKSESPHREIAMEQSLVDRSKRPYNPLKVPLSKSSTRTLTIGRLHFSETTSNNMRKRGKLNPDQRYFLLVVEVRAYTKQGTYPICRLSSEKLIVRASNPGQFDNDAALWLKDKSGESIYRMSCVGINNETPDESLSVNGNLRLTGSVLVPSDERLKKCIIKNDCHQSLENLCKMSIYKYQYSTQYAECAGLSDQNRERLGVLGHELRDILPDAITEGSDITLPNGQVVPYPLFVNKDRLLMETIGALQELYKTSKILKSRLSELETRNEILEIIVKSTIGDPAILKILK